MIAPNIIAAAAETAMLPLTIFFALFAIAITRLPGDQGERLLAFFHGQHNAMLGDRRLGAARRAGRRAGSCLRGGSESRGRGAGGARALYPQRFGDRQFVRCLLAYATGRVAGRDRAVALCCRRRCRHRRWRCPPRSSLASLPAMLDGANRLVSAHQPRQEFVLPLTVAIFRATSPAMNLPQRSMSPHWRASRSPCGRHHRHSRGAGDQRGIGQPARLDQLVAYRSGRLPGDENPDRAAGTAGRGRDAARPDAHAGQRHHERCCHMRG